MSFALEVLGCLPDEALRRFDRVGGALKLAEVQAYYRIKHKERAAQEVERLHAEGGHAPGGGPQVRRFGG